MRRLQLGRQWWAVATICLWAFSGCGGHKPPGASPFAARVSLVPSPTTSLQLGNVIIFTATAQNASGGNVRASFTYTSSDTSILNIAPNGAACAGHWDALYQICTAGGTGVVLVTASANPASSASTLVYVHPPIDHITVTAISLNGLPIQEPCLSQSQTMTVEAHAFSQGTDITSAVGPFTWSANNGNVVRLTPLLYNVVYQNFTYNVATNQATAAAVTPGITQIYASASGVSSTSFQQLQANGSPLLDFFATCPIQTVTLEVGQAGSGQTSFVAAKGGGSSSATVVATVTDLAGSTSFPNTDGGIVLSKVPLTWTSTQPQVLSLASNCTQSCAASFQSTGAASINASCSPPTCNIGFPYVPPSLSTTTQVDACTAFFKPLFPNNPNFSCQLLIPVPTYPTPLASGPQTSSAISGLVTGATAPATVIAGTFGCAGLPPAICTPALYSVSTAKAQSGIPSLSPASPNSILFDLPGDKAYLGSEFGATIVAPGNIGSASGSTFTPLSTVTGEVLAVSPRGDTAVFSDTIHTPNQVYVASTPTGGTASFAPLNVSQASAAGVSPDELKTFIFGLDNNGNSNLYIYSPLLALQVVPLPAQTRVNAIAFSNNGAFTYVAESSGATASLNAFNTCNVSTINNQIAASVALPAAPLLMTVLPASQIGGLDSNGYPIPNGEHIFLLDPTGIDIVTLTQSGTGCPYGLSFVSGAPTLVQRIDFNQGTVHPMNFFVSSDGTLIYLLASDRNNILIYDFAASGWTGGIPLLNNVAPVTATISLDTGTILVAGNDGMLHEVTTGLNGFDYIPFQFPNLPDFLNPFCNFTPAAGPCTFNLLAVK